MGVGLVGLLRGLGDFMQDGVVDEAQVAPEEVDEDARVGHGAEALKTR